MSGAGNADGISRRARLLPIASLTVALASACASLGTPPDPEPGEFAEFSLQRARRDQLRDSTSAAPMRSDLPWPVGSVEAPRERWARASAGVEYDDHPVAISNAIGTLDEFSDDGAAAGVWFLDAGSRLFEHERFAGGAAISYWGSAWSDWNRTTHYPTLAAYLDWRFRDLWALRLRYDVGHSDVGGDGFATTHHVGPHFFRDWADAGVTEAWIEYYSFDFHRIGATFPRTQLGMVGGPCALPGGPIDTPCGPPDSKSDRSRRDRSGFGTIIGAEHRVRLGSRGTLLRGGYVYQHYIPEGAEFHGQSHSFWLASATPLLAGFTLDADFTYTYRFTRNTTSFPDPDDLEPNTVYAYAGHQRHDHVVHFASAFGHAITPRVSAAAEYGYTRHASDLESFDFDRHRIGATLTVHFE